MHAQRAGDRVGREWPRMPTANTRRQRPSTPARSRTQLRASPRRAAVVFRDRRGVSHDDGANVSAPTPLCGR